MTQRELIVLRVAAARRSRCALPFVVSNYRTFQFTLVLVYAIALLGLNMLTGYNGQISLGHGAFYAIGAYCAAILMDKFGVPYWATLPVAGAVCLRGRASCSACRRCASRACTWRSPPSRSAWRCRSCSSTSTSRNGPAACRASSSPSPRRRSGCR